MGAPTEGVKLEAVARNAIAEAVHRGRFPADREPTPFEGEDRSGREYCFRIADAVLPLVSGPEAAKRIEELERSEENAWANWSGILEPLSHYAVQQPDYDIDKLPDGGPEVVGQSYIDLLETRLARALKAERLRDELLEAGRSVVDCWGVGRLNVTAMGDFIEALRAAITKAEGQS